MSEQGRATSTRWQRVRTASVEVAFIAACAALVYGVVAKERSTAIVEATATGATKGGTKRGAEPPLPAEAISLEGIQLQGSPTARVVLLEYGDYQCPYCGQFARDTQPVLEEKFVRTGKVRLGYLHLPLPNHRLAQKAAEGAECAGEQGRFWDMHGRLFGERPQLTEADLLAHATAPGLDTPAFTECLAGKMGDKVRADASRAAESP